MKKNRQPELEIKTSNYRLNPEMFLFKLCPSEIFEPTSKEMIQGIYIPLEYWNLLMASPETDGKQGGKIITYSNGKSNVKRYFNNTLFIELVKSGWIGSHVVEQDKITQIIKEALENKHSVMLAEKFS